MWNEEEKMTVVEILARESFDYMVVNLVLNKNLSMVFGSGENLQNKLLDLTEHLNVSNFNWNYVIFWQIS